MSYLRIIVGFFFISVYPRHSTVLCFLLVQQNLFSYLLNMNTLCQTLGTKGLTEETRSLLNKFIVAWKKEGMVEGIRECFRHVQWTASVSQLFLLLITNFFWRLWCIIFPPAIMKMQESSSPILLFYPYQSRKSSQVVCSRSIFWKG